MTEVTVVGGGIVGAAAAAACARSGAGVVLVERRGLAGGASALDLALLPAGADASPYLELHHFTGGAFFLDRSPPDGWPARRIGARAAAAALAAEARSYGADIRVGCEAKALVVRSGSVRGVLTDEGELGADIVVLATGVDTWRLCAPHGLDPPATADRGEVAIYARDGEDPVTPLVGEGFWAAQDETGRLHVARPDRAGAVLPRLADREPLERRTLEAAAGRSVRVEGVEGLVLALADAGRGVELAPALASVVAELVARG